MQLSLKRPQTSQTWAPHHSQDHLGPDPLTITRSSCKSAAARLGERSIPRAGVLSPGPTMPVRYPSNTFSRAPKDFLTRLLSQTDPLQGLRSCSLGPGSLRPLGPSSAWVLLQPQDGVARLAVLSPRPSHHLGRSLLKPSSHSPGPLALGRCPLYHFRPWLLLPESPPFSRLGPCDSTPPLRAIASASFPELSMVAATVLSKRPDPGPRGTQPRPGRGSQVGGSLAGGVDVAPARAACCPAPCDLRRPTSGLVARCAPAGHAPTGRRTRTRDSPSPIGEPPLQRLRKQPRRTPHSSWCALRYPT